MPSSKLTLKLGTGIATGAVALLLCAGCGSDSDSGVRTTTDSSGSAGPSTPSTESSSPVNPSESPVSSPSATDLAGSLPSCDSVWQPGLVLDERYYGCTDASGKVVEPDGTVCESGQEIVAYGNRFYAALGGKINASQNLRKDRQYRKQIRACRA